MYENHAQRVMYGSGGSAAALEEPPERETLADAVALRYLGRRTLFLRGAVTGRLYMARPRVAPLLCDLRDAPALLANRMFKRFAS